MSDVLVIDDHWMVRRGLSEVLADIPGQGEVIETATLHEAFATLRARLNDIDVVTLDIMLGDESGLSAVEQMKAIKKSLRVLMLSYLDEDPHGVRAIEQGADGYLTKGGRPHELVDAVKALRAGKRYVSANLSGLLARRLQHGRDLSPREWEVVRYYVMGKGCVETARLLSLSPKTVSSHKTNAMRKLGIHTSADLIRWGIDHGI